MLASRGWFGDGGGPCRRAHDRHRGDRSQREDRPACRLALTAPVTGSRVYVIAADDTLMDTPSAELARQVFPDVPVTGALDGYASLL